MDAKPDWVPEWIWHIYREIQSGSEGMYPARDKMLDILMADRQCAVVWNAITRRKGKAFKTFAEKNGFLPESTSDLSEDGEKILLCRIPVFASGLSAEDQAPAAKRSRDGKKIARLASELRTALSNARVESERWPYPLANGLMAHIGHRTSKYDDLYGWERDTLYDPQLALDHLYDALDAIKYAGEAWASWVSHISRPNDPNAARLHFIREMTSLFRRMYDSPLRECVAALTNSLFACDIDAAIVTKLAP